MKRLSPEAIDALSTCLELPTQEGGYGVLPSIRITAKLDRKVYVEVNAVLEQLGFAWNRKKQSHVLVQAHHGDATSVDEALDQVLTDGGWSNTKRNLDQFFTPAPLADRLVREADVQGRTVLEPSAGRGALALAAVAAGASITAIELDPRHVAFLTRAMSIGQRPARILQADFLKVGAGTPTSPGQHIGLFDRVIMNPPFSKQRDIDHVTHAFHFLRPGGTLTAVMAAGVTFRGNSKTIHFRAFVDRNRGMIALLPDESFAESGTSVRTVRVTMVHP